jgi:hypothetical protein
MRLQEALENPSSTTFCPSHAVAWLGPKLIIEAGPNLVDNPTPRFETT